eukprot:Pgem_evm1s1267
MQNEIDLRFFHTPNTHQRFENFTDKFDFCKALLERAHECLVFISRKVEKKIMEEKNDNNDDNDDVGIGKGFDLEGVIGFGIGGDQGIDDDQGINDALIEACKYIECAQNQHLNITNRTMSSLFKNYSLAKLSKIK